MLDKINDALRQTEVKSGVRVLYACESGSRAWGFASPDSDYDVRFVYAHQRDWYMRLEKTRDTIDRMLPDDIDLCGWDLRKTLHLFGGCNLALNEWIGSPIVYSAVPEFIEPLRALVADYFNPKKAMFHYLKMAERAHADNPLDATGAMNVKKLFYVLRPLFACRWITQFRTMPPTEFAAMRQRIEVESNVTAAIDEMLRVKCDAGEKDSTVLPPPLVEWIQTSLVWSQASAESCEPYKDRHGWQQLNRLMLDWAQ